MEKYFCELEKMITKINDHFPGISISNELFCSDITLEIKPGENFMERCSTLIQFFLRNINHVKKWSVYIGASYECPEYYFIHDWTVVDGTGTWIYKSKRLLDRREIICEVESCTQLDFYVHCLTFLHLKMT